MSSLSARRLRISIHALREEGDGRSLKSYSTSSDFYPRPPRGGRRGRSLKSYSTSSDFYPRPPRGGRRNNVQCFNRFQNDFYPRPPRGGRRLWSWRHAACLFISIHALREEGDLSVLDTSVTATVFLSTPSARRATWYVVLVVCQCHISIHALREEGDVRKSTIFMGLYYFYPRPPRGGRRSTGGAKTVTLTFLSTPSARRATRVERDLRPHPQISIHALREEGDNLGMSFSAVLVYFYPRPPRGGRQPLSPGR